MVLPLPFLPDAGCLSESHQPGLVAALDLFAMFRPGSSGINFATVGVSAQAFSPAMIAGNEKGGVAFIKGVLLAVFPQLADKLVVLMGSIQILLPFAMMPIIIGLAKLYEEKLWMLLPEGLQSTVQSHAVVSYLFAHPVGERKSTGNSLLR